MSKKTLISALLASLVVGATSTTFAANNPFTDVPADSWAYDAVSTLAADGVIDGYPDGTYQGQNTMTRYEMAQIVARAMAKTDLEKADKALVDKLAAEFADELDNLGVRVADLEKKSDNVKWGGKLRYRYVDEDHDNGKDSLENSVKLRLEPKAYIGNSGWTANARLDYKLNLSTDSNADDVTVDRAWVQGPLFNGTVQAGKVPLFTAQGMLIDDPFSGATYSFGNDKFKGIIAAGRYNAGHDTLSNDEKTTGLTSRDITAEYYGTQFDFIPNDKLALNLGYTMLKDIENNNGAVKTLNFDDTELNIWHAGGSYSFDKNIKLVGEYAQSDADDYDESGIIQLNYKEAKKSDRGSWGAYAGYAQFARNSVIKPTQNIPNPDQKGLILGLAYIPAENIVASIEYFDGKDIDSDQDANTIFGQVDFCF